MSGFPFAPRVFARAVLLAVCAGPLCVRAAGVEVIPRGEVLLQAAAATTPAPDAGPPPAASLLPVVANTTVSSPRATITPAEYRAEQAGAPEEVVLRITTVKATPAQAQDDSIGPGAEAVAARAVIINVVRTKTDLKIGSVIYLLYGYAPAAPGKPGPPPIPIVQLNADYHAFLNGGSGDTPYHPAAGAQSFLAPQALAADATAPAKAASLPANPAMLPTPNNPKPKGAVHITGNSLSQFVTLVQTGNQWGASITHGNPLPLATQGTEPPELMGFYSAPLGAPASQPTVLVYRASVLPAPAPVTGTLTSIRALVVGSDGRLLGDAPWSRILSDDSQPPLPPYTWNWSSYKVDITDPDTNKVQTIMLNAADAPTTPATSPADAAAK